MRASLAAAVPPSATPAGSVDIAGLEVVDVDGPEALIEVTDLDEGSVDAIRRAILTAGLDRGEVRELATVRTPLSEIYREVTA